MKLIKFLLKKIIVGSFILYSFNYIAINYSIVLPINFINIIFVSILGPFGICGLIFFKYIFMWGIYEWIIQSKNKLY